jgi:hypothetical protein
MTLMDPDDHYPLFIFAAPESTPTAWELSYDRAEESLRRVDPEARIDRGDMALGSDELFWYQVTFPFGWVEGNAGVRHNWLSIMDATIDTAAHFAAWLRKNLVPAGAGIEFNFTDGIDERAAPGTLPDSDDVDVLKAVLEEHVRGVIDG